MSVLGIRPGAPGFGEGNHVTMGRPVAGQPTDYAGMLTALKELAPQDVGIERVVSRFAERPHVSYMMSGIQAPPPESNDVPPSAPPAGG